jgi:hypothetical protein
MIIEYCASQATPAFSTCLRATSDGIGMDKVCACSVTTAGQWHGCLGACAPLLDEVCASESIANLGVSLNLPMNPFRAKLIASQWGAESSTEELPNAPYLGSHSDVDPSKCCPEGAVYDEFPGGGGYCYSESGDDPVQDISHNEGVHETVAKQGRHTDLLDDLLDDDDDATSHGDIHDYQDGHRGQLLEAIADNDLDLLRQLLTPERERLTSMPSSHAGPLSPQQLDPFAAIRAGPSRGETALMLAAKKGDPRVVRMLLKHWQYRRTIDLVQRVRPFEPQKDAPFLPTALHYAASFCFDSFFLVGPPKHALHLWTRKMA